MKKNLFTRVTLADREAAEAKQQSSVKLPDIDWTVIDFGSTPGVNAASSHSVQPPEKVTSVTKEVLVAVKKMYQTLDRNNKNKFLKKVINHGVQPFVVEDIQNNQEPSKRGSGYFRETYLLDRAKTMDANQRRLEDKQRRKDPFRPVEDPNAPPKPKPLPPPSVMKVLSRNIVRRQVAPNVEGQNGGDVVPDPDFDRASFVTSLIDKCYGIFLFIVVRNALLIHKKMLAQANPRLLVCRDLQCNGFLVIMEF